MDDLGVVGILGLENFERQKESCEAEFVKELVRIKLFLKHSIIRI